MIISVLVGKEGRPCTTEQLITGYIVLVTSLLLIYCKKHSSDLTQLQTKNNYTTTQPAL